MLLGSILHGDCLDVLRTLEADSLDSLVTDPPAGISFMGKGWDGDKGGRDQWIAWLAALSEGMRFLGIEADASYHAIAQKRLEAV